MRLKVKIPKNNCVGDVAFSSCRWLTNSHLIIDLQRLRYAAQTHTW